MVSRDVWHFSALQTQVRWPEMQDFLKRYEEILAIWMLQTGWRAWMMDLCAVHSELRSQRGLQKPVARLERWLKSPEKGSGQVLEAVSRRSKR